MVPLGALAPRLVASRLIQNPGNVRQSAVRAGNAGVASSIATDTTSSRETAILDAERQLIQSLFDYGSATHPDPVLRSTVWTREHAMLVLATATAVAQRLFSAEVAR